MISLSTSSSAPQSVDSGLQLPSAPLVVSGAATPLATESVESGVVEPSASGAESSTAATGSATGSDGWKVHAKPLRPDTLKKAKQPRVLKKVTIAQRVEKYGKYGLYDNNGALYCKPCGKKMDETWEDSLTKHVTSGIHDAACANYTHTGANFGCRSELQTHPAHKEMQMGSLCALIFFWQALFVHGKPIFSARQMTKKCKKNRCRN